MRFTVCIPTLNAGRHWPEFWDALRKQTIQPEEVIVLDSHSTDGTADLAKSSGARVVHIERGQFRHGGTRQLGAELAGDVDLLLYMTQDSVLADHDSVQRLLARFNDTHISAVYGRQLPRRGASPIEAHARLYNYPATSALRSIDHAPALGFKCIFFSNSFGAYRRSMLMQVGGFPIETNFGEDTQVAAKMLLAGYKIAYAADAAVFHSHALSMAQDFRRYAQVGRMHGSEPWLEHHFGAVSGEGLRFVRSELMFLAREAPHLWPMALVRSATKLIAYRHGKRKATRLAVRSQVTVSEQPRLLSRVLKARIRNHSPAVARETHD
jgi:rhamnosyltransferase